VLKPKSKDSKLLNKVAAMQTNADADVQFEMERKKTKFLMLTVDLPPVPLFKEQEKLSAIPQVNLLQLLKKFDGKTFVEEAVTGFRKRYEIRALPRILILHMKRFQTNDFFQEKNPTIVTFPLTNLDLGNLVKNGESASKYNLIANIIHDGKPGAGSYRVQVKHKPTGEWFDMQDLLVERVLPEQVAISESYIQIFERCD